MHHSVLKTKFLFFFLYICFISCDWKILFIFPKYQIIQYGWLEGDTHKTTRYLPACLPRLYLAWETHYRQRCIHITHTPLSTCFSSALAHTFLYTYTHVARRHTLCIVRTECNVRIWQFYITITPSKVKSSEYTGDHGWEHLYINIK